VIKFWNRWRGATSPTTRLSTVSAPATTAREDHSCCDDEELAVFLDDAYEVFACTAVMMAEGDALLERMQTVEVRAAMRRAFDASPNDLRKAAIEAARSSER
jgi:hypothetical protein